MSRYIAESNLCRVKVLGVCLIWLSLVNICYGQVQASMNREAPSLEQAGSFKITDAPSDSFLVDSVALQPPYRYLLHQVDIHFEETGRSIEAVMKYLVRIQQRRKTEQPVANITIPYYFNRQVEQIESLEATIYRSNLSWAKLDSSIFNRINLNARFDLIESTPVALDSGEVIEFSYTIRRAFIEQLRSIPMGFRVPLEKSVVRIENPSYLRFEGIATGRSIPIEHTIQEVDTSSVPKIFTFPQPEPLMYEYWWTESQPSYPPEPYVVSETAYRPELVLRMSQFGQPRQYLEDSWELVVAKIRREIGPWQQIESVPSSSYPEIGLDSMTSDRKKMNAIYQYVNQKAVYNEQQRAFSEQPLSSVLKGQPADLATINQLLVAWLRAEGFDANLLYTSSRSGGLLAKQLPSRFQLDAVVAAVSISGDTLLLDASDPYGVPDRLPVEYNLGAGLNVTPDTFSWQEIEPSKSIFELDLQINADLKRNGNLEGTILGEAGGYQAQWIQQELSSGNPQEQILRTLLLDGYPEVAWDEINLKIGGSAQKVSFEADFIVSEYSRTFREGIEFRPLVTGVLWEQPFKDSTRTVPVTFNAPEKIQMSYEITLPPNLKVPSLPSDQVKRMNGAYLIESYDQEDQKIYYQYDISLQKTQYPVAQYSQLQALYARWVDLSRMRWMLKK